MYLSMGHTMWNFPLPSFVAENPMIIGLSQMLLAGIVMVINQKFFINGAKGLINRSPNMDTLVALGSSAAFIYSTYSLLRFIENYMIPLKESGVQWGYAPQYMLTGQLNRHPEEAIRFTEQKRTDYTEFYKELLDNF